MFTCSSVWCSPYGGGSSVWWNPVAIRTSVQIAAIVGPVTISLQSKKKETYTLWPKLTNWIQKISSLCKWKSILWIIFLMIIFLNLFRPTTCVRKIVWSSWNYIWIKILLDNIKPKRPMWYTLVVGIHVILQCLGTFLRRPNCKFSWQSRNLHSEKFYATFFFLIFFKSRQSLTHYLRMNYYVQKMGG